MGENASSDSKLIEAAQREIAGLADALESARQPKIKIPGYDILREIQRGGQGVVYLGMQRGTRRQVAIKVLRQGQLATLAERARFQQEVRLLAQLNHPNIVAIHDAGDADGHFYFVMDFIAGQSLDALIEDGHRGIRETISLFVKICDAIHAAHRHGVIHRDLKPNNIRIDATGEPRILDFGLAKIANDSDAAAQIGVSTSDNINTVTGQFLGSLPWASPEQAEGFKAIDFRTDVYSLGVIFYQLLTGEFPYPVGGAVRQVMDNILMAKPIKPSAIRRELDNDIETIVLKCLAKDAERRYGGVGNVSDDLRRYLNGEAIDAKRDSSWYVVRKTVFRNARTSIATAAVIVVIVSCAVISGYFYGQSRTAETDRENVVELATVQAKQLDSLADDSRMELRRLAFGWFLLEWRDGLIARAHAIREKFSHTTVEYAVAGFLLDDTASVDQLLHEFPQNESLVLLAAGARSLRDGQTAEAEGFFARVKQAKGDDWTKAAAIARLEQMKKIVAQASGGSTQ